LRNCGLSTRRASPASARSPLRRFWAARQIRLQIRPRLLRLTWRDAQAELDRRQGETRFDHQGGQSLYSTASGVGRHLGPAGSAKPQGRVVRLAGCAQSAQTGQGRGRSVGQQARPDRLGYHHHRRSLPQLHLCEGLIPSRARQSKGERGLKSLASGRRRDELNGETIDNHRTLRNGSGAHSSPP
jgi:hypothetical protein